MPYLLLCVCGFARRTWSEASAEAAAAWHRDWGGAEGADHVVSVEWVDRLRPEPAPGGGAT